MLDAKGSLIHIGDRVDIGEGWATGVVVFSLDTGEFSPEYPEEHWAYLKRGVMVDTDKAGLIHYEDNSDELEIIGPNPPSP
jgi:hypothetical protein